MREALAANRQIAAKLSELESRLENHDADIQELVAAIRSLMSPPARNPKRIGFEANCKSSLHLEKNRRLQNVRRTER
jgi:glutamine synthetase type III